MAHGLKRRHHGLSLDSLVRNAHVLRGVEIEMKIGHGKVTKVMGEGNSRSGGAKEMKLRWKTIGSTHQQGRSQKLEFFFVRRGQ